MRSFFAAVARFSLRFKAVTLALVVLTLVLGAVAGTRLKQELLPPIEFPQTFILAQVSGMSSEQVLNVVTQRIETEIRTIPEIVNLESTTTSAIGAVIIAANDFGLNQAKLRDQIQVAIDRVWFPSRIIMAPDGESATVFAKERIGELTPEHWLFFQQKNPNFLFELRADIWETMSDDSLEAVLGYLATQVLSSDDGKSALQRLVEQEIVPQINTVAQVANVQVSGGQALPGEESLLGSTVVDGGNARSFLLQLSPSVWEVISQRVDGLGELNADAVATLAKNAYSVPDTPPSLPNGWVAPKFSTVQDIIEVSPRSVANTLATFLDKGVIRGALGQTDDLTADDIQQMLAIDPTMVNYFKAEHLIAMPQEAFDALPTDFIEGLDGFTQDAITARSLAQALSGDAYTPKPVNLPTAWKIQSPQIITFSLASIPLATFSVFSTNELEVGATPAEIQPVAPPSETTISIEPTPVVDPNAPTLPRLFGLVGGFFGATLDSADDFIEIGLSGAFAEQFGISQIRGAELLNQLVQLSGGALVGGGTEGLGNINVGEFATAITECGFGLLDINLQNPDIAQIVIGCITPEVMSYWMANDANFVETLASGVFDYLRDDVLSLEGVVPPLASAWTTLSDQLPAPLKTAEDVVLLGGGSASQVLNAINASVPEGFAGYEVRILDSLSVGTVRYFILKEPTFFEKLSGDVVMKLSQPVLALIPNEVLNTYDATVQETVKGILSGDLPTMAITLSERYASTTTVEPTDPDAPALNAEWQQLVSFVGADQLANASDFFRLPSANGTPAQFINRIFVQAPPAFANSLIRGFSIEVLTYIQRRDATFLDSLDATVLQALSQDVLAQLPQLIQDKASAGEVFVPTSQVTRTNGLTSLLVTVSKDQNANTVEAFYAVKSIVDKINAENEDIEVVVAFEQSSFVEESISGVVREGTLGAFFAIIIILVFLSGGEWGSGGKRVTGIVITVLAGLLLVGLIGLGLQEHAGDIGLAWDKADTVLRLIGILGILAGITITFYPGKMPYPAWRSTLAIAVSIPLSIAAALALMLWLPPFLNGLLAPLAESSPIVQFILRLAPTNLTLNIMTLSGLTVAVGRVVDDSIVVLENIFRQIQQGGMSKQEAIITGTRDVSVAIFSATAITVVVFLPLGLTGGLVGEFFLPFGLAVTYALATSFVVAVTVMPVLVDLFISMKDAHDEDGETVLERLYVNVLKPMVARNAGLLRWVVMILAVASVGIGGVLFASRPATFLPSFGEPQIAITVNLPQGTKIIETDVLVRQAEKLVEEIIPEEELKSVRTIIGGGGLNIEALIGGGGGVSENLAEITATLETTDKAKIDSYTQRIREESITLFGEDSVSVSKASLTSQGFGSFEAVLSGADQAILAQIDQCILRVLGEVEGLANVVSNLSQAGLATAPCPTLRYTVNGQLDGVMQEAIASAVRAVFAPNKVIVTFDVEASTVLVAMLDQTLLLENQESIEVALGSVSGLSDVIKVDEALPVSAESAGVVVYFRINGAPALSYTGEIESEDTINLLTQAIALVQEQVDLPEGYTVGQGFDSQFQTEGFAGIFVAIGIAGVIVCAILVVVFGSPVYWLAVIFSVVVAPVGAAVALTVTGRVLGISALIGLLMLLGLVVTNAVVLIDRVGANRHERKMKTPDALLEAGSRRLRPILMTALATIFALMPLAVGLSKGALIAEELGTVVIGGLVSSTLLTLIVVPVAYYLFTPIHNFFIKRDRDTGL